MLVFFSFWFVFSTFAVDQVKNDLVWLILFKMNVWFSCYFLFLRELKRTHTHTHDHIIHLLWTGTIKFPGCPNFANNSKHINDFMYSPIPKFPEKMKHTREEEVTHFLLFFFLLFIWEYWYTTLYWIFWMGDDMLVMVLCFHCFVCVLFPFHFSQAYHLRSQSRIDKKSERTWNLAWMWLFFVVVVYQNSECAQSMFG